MHQLSVNVFSKKVVIGDNILKNTKFYHKVNINVGNSQLVGNLPVGYLHVWRGLGFEFRTIELQIHLVLNATSNTNSADYVFLTPV